MKYVCKKKCFFRKRQWVPGEVLVPEPDEKVPEHFVKKGEAKVDKPKAKEAEPKTFKELHEKESNVSLQKPSGEQKPGPVERSPELAEALA